MDRIIKFRAYDPNKGMFEPHSVKNNKAFIMEPCIKDDVEISVNGINYYSSWDTEVATDFPLMQFTGLTDKNGTEIYEGDIVEMFYQDWLDQTRVIMFKNGSFGYGDGKYMFSPFHCLEIDMRNACYSFNHAFKVIGNIYENPEILKNLGFMY